MKVKVRTLKRLIGGSRISNAWPSARTLLGRPREGTKATKARLEEPRPWMAVAGSKTRPRGSMLDGGSEDNINEK